MGILRTNDIKSTMTLNLAVFNLLKQKSSIHEDFNTFCKLTLIGLLFFHPQTGMNLQLNGKQEYPSF